MTPLEDAVRDYVGELSAARKIAGERNRSFRSVRVSDSRRAGIRRPVDFLQTISRVLILISDVSVRCTGHLSAISNSLARCSAVSEPDNSDVSLDLVQHSFSGFAVRAILGVDFLDGEGGR